MKLFRPELFARRPACVLLDLDNTLYAYEPCHAAGTASARKLAEQSLNLAHADFDRCFADARSEIKARLGDQAASHHRLLYFQRMLERAGLASRPFEALQLAQAYWRAYIDAARLFPHVMDFLDDLRLSDIPAVIVTDLTAEIQLRKMIALDLDSRIDWIVTSEESGHDKPHPASFELALAKLGGIEGPVWMIGDNHQCDLVGAKRAIGAITLQNLQPGVAAAPKDCPDTDANFSSFADLRRLIDQLPED
jgi:putative hydrolase of the HAD superfamily